ncbi:MAG: tRNA (adenosine(37)-N6)-threonylcarbamoyltransferase complex dimerization subunit type 1 TsaB [Alphaproteobacteria bacterium]
MLVLGIETSTRLGSVGVVECPGTSPGGSGDVVLAEVTRDSELRHGAALPGLLDEALASAGRDLAEVEVVAVSIGPGSFTGLRVALATAKGLVLGTSVRLVGVPTLAALAEAARARLLAAGREIAPGALLAPCLDARRGEVYGAMFAVPGSPSGAQPDEGAESRSPAVSATGSSLLPLEPPGAFEPAAFGRVVAERAAGHAAFVFGEGASRYRDAIEAALACRAEILDEAAGAPSGVAVARLGARGGGSPGDAACLEPFYVRASEAERNRAAALALRES